MSEQITAYITEGDKITANITYGGGGEINTASNAGTGISLYYNKDGADLQFNGIKSENSILGIALDAATHDIEFTVNVGNINHNSLLNTHNLTSDIDHNQLTNYVLAQHRIINDSGTSGTELWSASKINTELGSISSSSISTGGTGLYTAETTGRLVGHSTGTGSSLIFEMFEGSATPVSVLQVDGNGNLFNNNIYRLVYNSDNSLFVGTNSAHSSLGSGATQNIGIGRLTLDKLSTGDRNTTCGSLSGITLSTAVDNAFYGAFSGNLSTGNYNSFFGTASGRRNTGANNTFLGYSAGTYQLAVSNTIIIDSRLRANAATELTDSPIVALTNVTASSQWVRLNGVLELTQVKSGATQVASGAAANEVWKTASHATLPDNVLMIGI